MRTLAMLATCLLVGAAMAATLTWFFRRLKRIEEDLWKKRAAAAERLSAREK